MTYKWNHLVPGSGLVDLELGRFDTLTYHDWITDTTVDDGHGWGYLKETKYKSLSTLLHYLIDNVSKNGYLLLNVGPQPDGQIPNRPKHCWQDWESGCRLTARRYTARPPGWFTAKDRPK